MRKIMFPLISYIHFLIFVFLISSTADSNELHEAVRENNITLAVSLINSGYDVNEWDEVEGYPLEYAIGTSGSVEMAVVLLNNGANPNIHSLNRMNYDHVLRLTDSFSFSKTLSKIVLLLAYGADPSDNYGWEYTQAVTSNNFLHLIIYSLWAFDQKPAKPKTLMELNEIITKLPLLKIQCLLKLLNEGLPINDLWPSEIMLLENSLIY